MSSLDTLTLALTLVLKATALAAGASKTRPLQAPSGEDSSVKTIEDVHSFEGLVGLVESLTLKNSNMARAYYGELAAQEVGEAVEQLLQDRELSQEQVCERTGVSERRLRDLLNGDASRDITLSELALIAWTANARLQVVFTPLEHKSSLKELAVQADELAEATARLQAVIASAPS